MYVQSRQSAAVQSHSRANSYIETCLFIRMSVAIGQDCETDEGE